MSAWPGRLLPDRSLRRLDGGRILIGGSPLRVLRFSEPIDLDAVHSPAIIDLLVDGGLAHPAPASGPFGPHEVTIVIPVLDEPDAVMQSLEALAAAGDPPSEVIVVDDGSQHRPIEPNLWPLDRWPFPVRSISLPHNRGPAAARNAGLASVATPLVVYLDAGCTPELADAGHDTGWLTSLLAQFADPRLALVAPRIVATGSPAGRAPVRGSATTLRGCITDRIARYEYERSPLDLGGESARVTPRTRVSYVPTACVMARVEALRAIDGFDESLRIGEDVDLVWRLGEANPSWRVRYEPSVVVGYRARTSPGAWLKRRVAYGESAAPLDRRHPGAVAPVSTSPWSMAAWGCIATGHPVAGAATVTLSVALLARKLRGLPEPIRSALRLAGLGNLAAARLLADALRRAWWPAAAAAVVVGPRRVRGAVAAAFLVPPILEWVTTHPELDPVSFVLLRTADDVAYGNGVLIGCITERAIGPLLPDFGAGKVLSRGGGPTG